MVRKLLQTDGQCQLAGISVGGWIVLSLLAGILVGVAATVLGQWYRRRKQLRYLDKAPPLIADERGMLLQQPSSIAMQHMPGPTSAVRLPPAPGARPGLQPKYYSPLTKSLSVGPGMLTAQLSQADHRSVRTTEAGDINSRVMQDQSSLSNLNHAQPQVPSANPNNPFAVHSHKAPAEHLGAAAVTEGGAIGHVRQGLRGPQNVDQTRQSCAVVTTRLQPQSISSRSSSLDPTTDYQLPASIPPKESSSVASPAASSPSHACRAPAAQCQQQGQGAAAAAARQQWGSAPGSSAAGSVCIQAELMQAGAGAITAEVSATESEIADEYEIEDLDDDWKALLTDVDARLLAQGCRVMNAKERSVAIKKMLVATGTRGVDFAMHATLQEVLAFRSIHGN